MNLKEHIKKVLREEDFIPLEDLNTVIKDYEDGFDVFIMNGDKKIGEISFVKESIPNLYTIVDGTIDDEYKGNRIYPKTIINLFKERPNLIINSVFRSPEAEKAWRYILSNLPPNIGKSVKYYKEEDTTLYQLKLRNIQEHIRRILRESIDKSENITRVKEVMGVINEGLHDTSWENDEGDKITLMDLLNATEDIPVKKISLKKIKSKLLTWDEDEDEVKKIESANLRYPILIFVDDNNKFISIIDGHHRAQKAVRHKLKTIKAKLIPINSLPKNIRKVFSHMN